MEPVVPDRRSSRCRHLRRTSDNCRQQRTNLTAKNFNQLAEPIHNDPVRAARVAEYREETLREIAAYQLAELRRDLGIDQSELGERLGMSRPGISIPGLRDFDA